MHGFSAGLSDFRQACAALACAAAVAAPAVAAERRDRPLPTRGAPAERVAPFQRTTPVDRAVATTTLDLLSFAHWPGNPPQVRLCVVGASVHADALLSARRPPDGGRRVSVRQRAPVDAGTDCDAVYLGRLPPGQLRALYQRIAGHAELVIGERPEDCTAGAAVCLDDRTPQADFDVNLASLARSGVRLHPGVLQLARHGSRAP